MTTESNKKIQKCILLFEGRTGSTWLIRMLQQSPDVTFLGEELAEFKSAGWEEQEKWVEKLFSAPLSFQDPRIKDNMKVIGFKIKLRDIANETKFKRIIEKHNAKIIYMKRTNVVKQTISSIRAIDLFKQNGIYNLNRKNKAKALGAYEIPIERFNETLQWLLAADERLSAFINDLSTPMLEVTYEDLLSNCEDTFYKILDFLDAERVVPVHHTVKHTSDNLQDIVTNYGEIKTNYMGTVYEKMFD